MLAAMHKWWGDTTPDVACTINLVHPSTLFLSFILPHAALSWVVVISERVRLTNLSNKAMSLLGGIAIQKKKLKLSL
jgi:hypothetical protein